MTREQEIRAEIALQLYAARPTGLSAAQMARNCRRAGYDYTEAELGREAAFLVGQGQAAEATNPITGAALYQITSAGVIEHERFGK